MPFLSWSWNTAPALYPSEDILGCVCFVGLEKAFDHVPQDVV